MNQAGLLWPQNRDWGGRRGREESQGPGVSPDIGSRTSPQLAQNRRKTNTNLQSAHGSPVWRGVGSMQMQSVPKNPCAAKYKGDWQ